MHDVGGGGIGKYDAAGIKQHELSGLSADAWYRGGPVMLKD